MSAMYSGSLAARIAWRRVSGSLSTSRISGLRSSNARVCGFDNIIWRRNSGLSVNDCMSGLCIMDRIMLGFDARVCCIDEAMSVGAVPAPAPAPPNMVAKGFAPAEAELVVGAAAGRGADDGAAAGLDPLTRWIVWPAWTPADKSIFRINHFWFDTHRSFLAYRDPSESAPCRLTAEGSVRRMHRPQLSFSAAPPSM